MGLHTLVFMSNPRRPLEEHELKAIACEIHERAAKVNVKSVLLYSPEYIFEVLEGDSDDLDRVLGRISRDERHGNIQVLLYRPIESRWITDTSMGVLPSQPNKVVNRESLTMIADTALQNTERAGEAALGMLTEFYHAMSSGAPCIIEPGSSGAQDLTGSNEHA